MLAVNMSHTGSKCFVSCGNCFLNKIVMSLKSGEEEYGLPCESMKCEHTDTRAQRTDSPGVQTVHNTKSWLQPYIFGYTWLGLFIYDNMGC